MREKMFEHQLTVRGYELDSYGHVNHAVYLNYLEQARWIAMRDAGLIDDLGSKGIKIVVIKVNIRYMREIGLLDEITVQTRIKKEPPYLVFYHWIRDSQKKSVMARAVVKTILLDERKTPLDIPEELMNKLGFDSEGNE